MSTAPSLFDRSALVAHRKRVSPDALFLHELARDEAQDRLAMVNKRFTKVAIVTPFPEIWIAQFPDACFASDSDTLDLAQGRFDLVIHAMCLHWSNDPVGQLIQCRRALSEDGLVLALLLGGQTLHELRAVLGQAETTVTGGVSPRVAPMAEIRDLGGLLQRAGLTMPVADSICQTVSYQSLTHLMHDLRAMGETNAQNGRLRHVTGRGVFDLASTLYAEHFAATDGRIAASFEMICLTGWSPSENQPKPKRPGSAQVRLADALAVPEVKLPD